MFWAGSRGWEAGTILLVVIEDAGQPCGDIWCKSVGPLLKAVTEEVEEKSVY
jgi:hypothetical protein